MQSTDLPAKFLVAFARDDASKVEVPVTSPDPTRFSQTLGSPPLTGVPIEAGGSPPQLPDFNGAMNQLSRGVLWTLAGGRFPYDNAWAANAEVGGYPRGAVLPAALGAGSIGMGEWYNNVQDNVANPDTAGTGWVPGYHYGATALTSQTGGTVTLTPAQAAKTVITLAGALTSNLVLVVPAWVYRWTFYNATSGGFTVTVRTASSAAVTIPQDGQPYDVRGNGTTVSRVEVIVPNASTTVAGITRLATVGETASASSDAIAVTPAGMAQTKSIAWVTGLQAALDSKAPINNPNFTGTVRSTGAMIPAGGFQDGSSRTVKDHVGYVTARSGLEQVLALVPVLYRYKDGVRVRVGYYAEDVEQVIPEAVHDQPADSWTPLTIENTQMLPAHTAAIQALHALLQDAYARIEALEAKL